MIISPFERIKRKMKDQGMTYKDLALQMELSEASIKRIFSKENCQLDQFHKICQIVHINPSEVYSSGQSILPPLIVSKELDEYFSQNEMVFLFYRQLSFCKDPFVLKRKHKMTQSRVDHYLKKLVLLGLIRIGSRQKVEFLFSEVMELPKNGKLIKQMREKWGPYLLQKIIENEGRDEHFLESFSVSLSKKSALHFYKKLLDLEDEMFIQAERDKPHLKDDRGYSFILAMAPYRMAIDGDID